MGRSEPRIDEYPVPCKDADRIALLTDFAAHMKAKLDLKDEKYGIGPYTLDKLAEHLSDEVDELYEAMARHIFDDKTINQVAAECIDVANMAFLMREKCLRMMQEKIK